MLAGCSARIYRAIYKNLRAATPRINEIALNLKMCAICLLEKQRSLHHSKLYAWLQAQLHSKYAISGVKPFFPIAVAVGTGHD